MYDQLHQENVICKHKVGEAHIHEHELARALGKFKALKAKARARKKRIQKLNEELHNKTMLIQDLEGELQETNELIHNLQIEVQENDDMDDDDVPAEEDPAEIQGESGGESGPGTP